MDEAQLVQSPRNLGSSRGVIIGPSHNKRELQSVEGTSNRYRQAQVKPGHGLEGDAYLVRDIGVKDDTGNESISGR